jgi:hypothetical protein
MEEKMRVFLIIFCNVFILIVSATIINIPVDQTTIQEGINVAVDGDTILVQPGSYVESINYNGKRIAVASLYLTTQDSTYISQTIIDGNNLDTVAKFEDSEDSLAVLCGFTITNGHRDDDRGGGITCWESSPSLSNLIISNNYSLNGGGIYCYSSFRVCLI